MSKKPRGKSGSAAGGGGNKWEAGLLAATIDEDDWTSSITLVAGNKLHDKTHIDMLAHAVQSEARRQFGIVHKQSLYEEVKELGNPKNKKGKDSPPHVDICETVRPIIENGDELPLGLLCRLIKFKILWLKQQDTQRIAAEKKAASDKEKGGGAAKGGKGKDKPKSAAKGKGKGAKTPEPPSVKGPTKLKKRGEEDEKVYLDDEPLDGASFYVIISGFNHPHLVTQLAEIGIYLDSVIRVSSDDYPPKTPVPEVNEDAPPKDEKTLALEEEVRVKKEKETAELESFWKDYPILIGSALEGSRLHDTAFDEIIVKKESIPEHLEDDKDGEKKMTYGMQVYEDVACKAYDILDLKRQHKNFLSNLKLIHVPVFSEEQQSDTAREAAPPADQTMSHAAAEVDMRYYADLMNTVPQESVSVPIIMHCMLEQIEATELGKEPPSEVQPPARSDGLEHGLAKHIGGLAFKLALSDTERQSLQTMFDQPAPNQESFKQPVLYNANDNIAFRTDHLSTVYGFNAKEAEMAMLERLPLIGALEAPTLTEQKSLERAARLQELLHFCVNEELRPSDIDHIFKQFVFETMSLTGTDEEGMVVPPLPTNITDVMDSSQAIPWDDPYPYYRCMLPAEEEEVEEVTDAFPMPDDDEILSGLSASPMSVLTATPSPRELASGGLAPPKTTASAAQAPPGSNDGSRPPTPGILKKTKDNSLSGSHIVTKRSGNSVHFSDMADETEDVTMNELDPDMEPEASANPMEEFVPSAHKRVLDEWCFAEHLDRHILLQVMKEASFTLPYVDTYYHKRDHCLLIVMHNPHNNKLQNEMCWSQKLHSNVGVRNYQEHVAELIADWTIAEEAKYHATLISEDVEQDITDAAKAAANAAKEAKKASRGRSKSPKGGRKGSAKSQSPKPSEAGVDNYITDGFVKEGSLKAHKAELDRAAKELEDEERAKAEKADKRARSGKKTADSAKGTKKDDRKPSRAGSKKQQKGEEPAPVVQEETAKPEEPYVPFVGYDLGTSKLMHVSGKVSTMFPTDGAIIRSEKIDFVQGATSVKTSVVKDGNVFMIHVCDPAKEEITAPCAAAEVSAEVEKSETEQQEKDKPNTEKIAVGKHGSFTANLKDGMSLSFSTYGLQGEPDHFKKYEPAPYITPAARSPSPAPDAAKASPAKKGKGKERTGTTPEPPPMSRRTSARGANSRLSRQGRAESVSQTRLSLGLPPSGRQVSSDRRSVSISKEDEVTTVETDEQEEVSSEPSFQSINLTCPDGLKLSFHVESSVTGVKSEPKKLLIKQSYPYKTLGKHKCEEARDTPAMQETSRVVRSDGTVVKHMSNGDVTVLYADGAVSKMTDVPQGLNITQRPDSAQLRTSSARSNREAQVTTPTKRGKRGKDAKAQQEEPENQEPVIEWKGQWVTTSPTGERVGKKLDGTAVELSNSLVSYASDPESGQMMITREDHVRIITYQSDMKIVEHEDGTRITTFTKDVEKSASDVEEKQDGVETVSQQFVRIECPGYAVVEFNCYTSYCMLQFGSGCLMSVTPTGSYYMYHKDGFNLEIDECGRILYVPDPKIQHQSNELIPARVGANIPSFKEQFAEGGRDLSYLLSHSDYVTVQTQDPDGNQFTVRHDGTHDVTLSQQYQEKVKNTDSVHAYSKHAPRFFVIQPDLTGTELLRHEDIAEYITAAENDADVAVMREPVVEHPGVTAITVLKPYTQNSSEAWLGKFSADSIIPPGLRSRDLKTLPPRETVTPGPKFGTNVGKGLAIGSMVKSPPNPTVLECPKKLELRQIIQYKPVSNVCRLGLYNDLKVYADFVCAREGHAQDIKPKDPRTEEDKIASIQLLKANKDKIKQVDVKSLYERVTAPKIPSPPHTPRSRRTQADIERDRQERQQEKENRGKLKNKDIPPYFESELGRAFLISNAADPKAFLEQLAEDPSANVATMLGLSTQVPPSSEEPKQLSPVSKARPQGPTPMRASGKGSPASTRPGNPTPAHAGSKADERKSNMSQRGGVTDQPIIEENPARLFNRLSEDVSPREKTFTVGGSAVSSMVYNVNGSPRTQPVHVPDYLTMGSKKNAFPNHHYTLVEEEVRRQTKTSSVANYKSRGFQLMPDFVDFGTLKEGITYSFNIAIKNVGIDTCRYKVRPPPPSTGLKVIYVPGPVAAGMKAELKLELYAIAIGVSGESGSGYMSHDLEICTETDVMYLPIKATVLTSDQYEKAAVELPRAGKAPGVKFVTDKPPNDYGVVRPRKDLKVASNGSDAILSFLN